MSEPSIRGGAPQPLPNEIIAIVMFVITLCGVGYFIWRIQRDGITAFRNSNLFWIAVILALSAYYAVYTGVNSAWR